MEVTDWPGLYICRGPHLNAAGGAPFSDREPRYQRTGPRPGTSSALGTEGV